MPSVGATPPTATATTTPLSPIRTSPTSKAPRAGGYHYEKKNPSSSSSSGATTPLPNTQQQITSSPRRGSRQEAAQVITTIGKNHKSNFSIGAFLGGAPHSALSGYTLPSGSRQSEPKTGGIREQFSGSLSQGPLLLPPPPPPPPKPSPPRTSPNPGAVGSTANRAGVITTTKLKALEASSSQDQTGPLLRNLSSSPLRLKMPTSLRKIGRSASNNKREPQTTTTTTPSRLNSLRPFSPFSLRSPIVEDEGRGLRSKSNKSQYSLGAMQFERGNSTGSSASSPSLSTASSQEEDLPLTPSTIRSGNLRPRSPVAPELPPSQGRSSNLSFSERPFPTITQDDLSLVHTTQLAADNRISRRASVSATSMLSSSNHLSSYDDGDRPRQQQQQQPHSSSTTTTTTPLTIPPTGRTDKSPLSPMTFERAPTPDLASAELHGYELPTPRLPPKASSTTHLLPPEKDIHDDDDNDDNVGSAPTPIATLNPEMPFNTFIIPSSTSHHLHDTSTTGGSNPQSRSVSRAGSSELGGGGTATAASDSRNSLSDTMHPRIGGGGGGFSSKKREKISPAQQALWEQDRERITRDMMDAYDGEAVLIRFEPKQGWIGFWNRGDIDRVIEGLRDLRSPKP